MNPLGSSRSGAAFPAGAVAVVYSARFWWVVCLFAAATQGWSARHEFAGDGLSYLDMGSYAAAGNLRALINGLWSPGYPALIGVMFALFRPSPEFEAPLVHLLNFLLFGGVLFSFSFFLRRLAAHLPENHPRPWLVPLGYGILLWNMLGMPGQPDPPTPDRLVAIFVFLAAGLCCQVLSRQGSWAGAILLGVVLGVGYWAKAAMLPIGLTLPVLMAILGRKDFRTPMKACVAGLAMVLVCSPLVILMSRHVGHFSISEAGTLNYDWYSGQLQPFWTADLHNGNGAPEHPPRILLTKPQTLDFSAAGLGTWPYWYEPSYWYAGAKSVIGLKPFMTVIRTNLGKYRRIFENGASLIAGLLALIFYRSGKGLPDGGYLQTLALWTVAASVVYLAVTVESRYLWGFGAVFWVAIYVAVSGQVTEQVRGPVTAVVMIALLMPMVIESAFSAGANVLEWKRGTQRDYIVAAAALRDHGIQRGDRIAYAGDTVGGSEFARCAGVRITALIPSDTELWGLDSQGVNRVKDALAASGVRALVAQDVPSGAAGGWEDLRTTPHAYSLMLLAPDTAIRLPEKKP
jgi:hypothetical protein